MERGEQAPESHPPGSEPVLDEQSISSGVLDCMIEVRTILYDGKEYWGPGI